MRRKGPKEERGRKGGHGEKGRLVYPEERIEGWRWRGAERERR